MTTPYRMATLTPPVDTSPPWWQRAWFRVALVDDRRHESEMTTRALVTGLVRCVEARR